MFTQFGITTSTLSPLHLFQFADDAAVVTEHEQENHTLLKSFHEMVYLGKHDNQS